MKWPRKKQQDYAYSLSIHKNKIYLAVLKSVVDPLDPDHAIQWNNTSWELIVNDDIDIVDGDTPAAVTALLLRYEKLAKKSQPLQLVLGAGLVQEVSLEKPNLPEEEIAGALQWTIKDLVTLPAEDIVADYYDPPIQAAGSKNIQVVVASRAFLMPILNVLHDAKFDIQGIVNSIQALTHWFTEEQKLVLLTESPNQVSQLHIIANRQLVLNRELTRVRPLSRIAADETDELEVLALEVQRSLDFYSGQLRQAPLGHLGVASGHAQAQQVASFLGAQLGLEHRVLDYPGWAKELQRGDYQDLAVLAGVAWLMEEPAQASEASS